MATLQKNLHFSKLRIVFVIILIIAFAFLLQQLKAAKQAEAIAKANELHAKFDFQRIEGTANILLAIQDFYFLNKVFPESVQQLIDTGSLPREQRIVDPERGTPYYYEKQDVGFVFCTTMHSGTVRGFNTSLCPKDAAAAPSVTPPSPDTSVQKIVDSSPPVALAGQPVSDTKGECPYFTKWLDVGIKDSEVEKLQQFLKDQKFLEASFEVTHLFDSRTQEAVKKFQLEHSEDLMKPFDISLPSGIWYQHSIDKANALLGCQ